MKYPLWLKKYKTNIILQEDSVAKEFESLMSDFIKLLKYNPNRCFCILINEIPYNVKNLDGKIDIQPSSFSRS